MKEVTLRCEGWGRRLTVAAGRNLLRALQEGGVAIAVACDGDAVCGRCNLRILAGDPGPETSEERHCKQRNGVRPDERLACCVQLQSDLTVHASYWPRASGS